MRCRRRFVVQNKVEAAYARSDLFERRRRLMDDWAAYLDGQADRTTDGTAGSTRRDVGHPDAERCEHPMCRAGL